MRPEDEGQGRRVLVTGGTGFVGRHTLPELLARGFQVHAVSRGTPEVPEGVVLHRVDLLQPGAAEALMRAVRPTHLLHLAWYLVPGQVWNSLENLRWVEASLGLTRAFAEEGGRRAVYGGTLSEYSPTDDPCREYDTPVDPPTLYGLTKDAVRRVALPTLEQAGVSVAWARVFFAFGPNEHPVRLVSSIARHLLLGEEAPCSHGRQVRDYSYTPELARALVDLVESKVDGVVNVGSGRSVTLREIVEELGRLTGRPELIRFGAVTPPPHEPPVVVADVSRLRDEVGFEPRLTLEEGLERTVDWWRSETHS